MAGAEALIRWQQADGTLVSPSEFIPVAAASPLITDIGSHMFSRLLTDMSTFDGSGEIPGGPVSFNVSTRDLEDDSFVTTMIDTLENAGVRADGIEVEVTENDALIGGERLRQNLRLLQDAGISLTMDDYGIGYSSIDSLSVWPFSTIKLDQGLIGRMLASKKNAKIVQSSIRMAHELNLKVVAEGVESPEQYDFLMDSGCQMVQGYLISKPLPLGEFTEFVSGESRWRGFPMGLVQMALIDHLQWRRQLVRRLIDKAQLPAASPRRLEDDYPEQCHTKCCLGKWYYGEGSAFRDHPVFQELDGPHRQLHQLANRLIKQVEEGAGLAEVTPELHGVTACSVELVGLLEELEDYGITQMRIQR
jgi:EAL domain-containing protein (putative c-di-GMP-specific phosphodiesterase class I)